MPHGAYRTRRYCTLFFAGTLRTPVVNANLLQPGIQVSLARYIHALTSDSEGPTSRSHGDSVSFGCDEWEASCLIFLAEKLLLEESFAYMWS